MFARFGELSGVGRSIFVALAVGGAAAAVAGATVGVSRLLSGDGMVAPTSDEHLRECVDSAAEWRFNAYLSDDDGVVLGQSSIGGRQVTKQLSVPYLEVEYLLNGGDTSTVRLELTPIPELASENAVGTTLTHWNCSRDAPVQGDDGSEKDLYVTAVFEVDQLEITQEYQFRGRDDSAPCEPSGKLRCARFWPSLSYSIREPDGCAEAPDGLGCSRVRKVTTVQRFEFAPSGISAGGIDAFRDRPTLTGAVVETKGSHSGTHSSMKYENEGRAIEDGGPGRWDNIHQSTEEHASLPGIWNPGCPTCIHMHWRWSKATNIPVPDIRDLQRTAFTDGRPHIPVGSTQDAWFGVVRQSPTDEEVDPVGLERGWRSLVDEKGTDESELRGHAPVVFWEMTSSGRGADGDGTFPLFDAGAIFVGAEHVPDRSAGAPPRRRTPTGKVTRDHLIAAMPSANDGPDGFSLESSVIDPSLLIESVQTNPPTDSCAASSQPDTEREVTKTTYTRGTGSVLNGYKEALIVTRRLDLDAAGTVAAWENAVQSCPVSDFVIDWVDDDRVDRRRRVIATPSIPLVGDASVATVSRIRLWGEGGDDSDWSVVGITFSTWNSWTTIALVRDHDGVLPEWPDRSPQDRARWESEALAAVSARAAELDRSLRDVVEG